MHTVMYALVWCMIKLITLVSGSLFQLHKDLITNKMHLKVLSYLNFSCSPYKTEVTNSTLTGKGKQIFFPRCNTRTTIFFVKNSFLGQWFSPQEYSDLFKVYIIESETKKLLTTCSWLVRVSISFLSDCVSFFNRLFFFWEDKSFFDKMGHLVHSFPGIVVGDGVLISIAEGVVTSICVDTVASVDSKALEHDFGSSWCAICCVSWDGFGASTISFMAYRINSMYLSWLDHLYVHFRGMHDLYLWHQLKDLSMQNISTKIRPSRTTVYYE